MQTGEFQYLDLCMKIIDKGEWIYNERTGKRVLTLINADLEYDMSEYKLPALTTKKVAWKSAIAEFLGYLNGYSSAADFRKLGCNTWNANANENTAWLESPYRKGHDDMGRVYGVQFRNWKGSPNYLNRIDQLDRIYQDLCRGVDNRREIMTAWNPGEEHLMCLPACIHTHTFSLVNETLHLTSYQRSADMMLGVPFNMIQLGFFLLFMARITGNKPGRVYHKIVNAHIYEDQLEIFKKEQMPRKMRLAPKLLMDHRINYLDDLEWITPESFVLYDYNPAPAISYPFSV